MPNNLSLKDAEAARNAVTAAQKSEISQLYSKWADEIAEKAKKFEGKTTMSAPLQAANLRQLEKELRAQSKQVANEVAGKAKDSLYKTSEAVIKSNAEWLQSFGYPPDGIAAAFTSVQDQVVKRIMTGQVYGGGWSLSKAIWGDNEKTLKDIHTIVAGGIVQNKPVYDVAKELEQYVSPGKAKQWNKTLTFYSKEKKPGFTYNPNGDPKRGMWEQKGRIYKKTVDYNAQRLVRTLAQHSYQQTLEGVCKKNPFVLKFVWHAEGSRACPMCLDLDGLVFDKGMLPLDHPNGMCTFEPVIDPDMVDKLADWVWADEGKYPEIDEFSKMLGFTPVKQMTAQEFMLKYGALEGAGSTAKSWTTWYNALPNDAQMAASTLKMSSGKGWQSWFADTIYSGDDAIAGSAKLKQLKKVEKIVQSDELSAKFIQGQSSESKTWTTWFNKLSQEDQMIAKGLKEKSGEGWATWYSKNVYTGDGVIGGSKGSSAAKKAAKVAKTEQKAVAAEQNGLTHEQFISKLKGALDDPNYLNSWMDVADEIGLDAGLEMKSEFHTALKKAAKSDGVFTGEAWDKYVSGKLQSKELDDLLAKVFNIEKKAQTASSSAVAGVAENAATKANTVTTVADDVALKKAANESLKKYIGVDDYTTTSPLYSKVEQSYGKSVLDDFKAALHEAKNAGGYKYHVDAWSAYLNETMDAKLASKIDKVLADGAKAAEKKVADEALKKAKEAEEHKKAVAEAKKKAEELKKKYGTASMAPDTHEWPEVLKGNTTEWMRANESANAATWTQKERRGINRYTGNHFTRMNGELNGIEKTDFVDAAEIENVIKKGVKDGSISQDTLDCYRGLQKSIVTEPTVVRRGTGLGEIGELFGDYGSYREASTACRAMTVDELKSNFIGRVGINRQFESCSPIPTGGFSGNAEFVFYLNPGCQGTVAWDVSQHSSELEFLMNSGHKMICKDIESGGGRGASVRVYIEVLPK